jgi:signal peptide peptidase SppA
MAGRSLQRGLKRTLSSVLPRAWLDIAPTIPVVRLQGAIGLATPFRPALTLAGIADVLDRAFAMSSIAGVALVINSPGGSAVQSHLIHRRIRQLAEEKDVPVTAFVEDVAASGGYMLACAADEIFVDPSSIVGSIGVISAGFGFGGLIERLGIERRLHTAGEHKSLLDPFLPEKEDDVRRLQAVQREVHRVFIDLVRERRGGRLAGGGEDLFSGDFWIGLDALQRGLVDGVGDLRAVMRLRHGDKVDLRPIRTPRPPLLRRLAGLATTGSGAGIGADMLAALEERALWARFGL